MALPVEDWPTCRQCAGAAIKGFEGCLAHLGPALDGFLDELSPGADIDCRGTTISWELLCRLLDAVTVDQQPRLGTARFDHARFVGPVSFADAILDVASFEDARFERAVSFRWVRAEELGFVNAKFEKRVWFGPLVPPTRLNLHRARFASRAEVVINGGEVDCELTRFEDGVNLLGSGSVVAAHTTFGAPSMIAGDGGTLAVRSLRATDVSNLELANVDLRSCEFAGAYRLDQLRLTGLCLFGSTPKGWRWTRRQTIIEEHHWRGWSSGDEPDVTAPDRVAALYRSLRKAMEDSKNEAGAGDFYYGEMDARRHSTETRRTERLILRFYWLLSGYGQRAGRALIALLVLIATVAVLLTVWGQPPVEAAQIAVGAVVLRDPGTELTEGGQWTVMVARFLGPVLLALAALAVRARVKR